MNERSNGSRSETFEAGAEARQRRLAAERAVDSVLEDSFPASDPPSWTAVTTHPPPAKPATTGGTHTTKHVESRRR